LAFYCVYANRYIQFVRSSQTILLSVVEYNKV
jgi:hypothetical protein